MVSVKRLKEGLLLFSSSLCAFPKKILYAKKNNKNANGHLNKSHVSRSGGDLTSSYICVLLNPNHDEPFFSECFLLLQITPQSLQSHHGNQTALNA